MKEDLFQESTGPGAASSEAEKDRAALSAALAAADRLARLASTVKLHNIQFDGTSKAEE